MYYVQDHLYDVAALVDSGGTVGERYEYDAYGKAAIMDGSYQSRTASSYENPYRFTGRRLDVVDEGVYDIQYNRNRYYDHAMGRWMSHDPLGYIDTVHLYKYARNNPFRLMDPRGTDPVENRRYCGDCPTATAVGRPTMETWGREVIWKPSQTIWGQDEWRWVDYEVDTYMTVGIKVVGRADLQGTGVYTLEDGELIKFRVPAGYTWPNYWRVVEQLTPPNGKWNFEGNYYRCRKRYTCRQQCCLRDKKWEVSWRKYETGILVWESDSLSGRPDCRIPFGEDPADICKEGQLKCAPGPPSRPRFRTFVLGRGIVNY
jgi:RHS repeat-associated protein